MSEPWFEPPLAGNEVEHLVGALERQRATFRWKADGLDADGLRLRIGASALSLGALLKHLALVEDVTFTLKLRGDPPAGPWTGTPVGPDNDWEIESAADDPPEELYALWDAAVARSRERLTAALSQGGLEQPVHIGTPDGRHASLRRILFDLVEEYSRHTGHADLLRETVDGRTGEDPPPDWVPVSGAPLAPRPGRRH